MPPDELALDNSCVDNTAMVAASGVLSTVVYAGQSNPAPWKKR